MNTWEMEAEIMEIEIKLPDGTIRGYAQGTTVIEIAASISVGLKKQAIAGKVDGRLVDLN